jgi:uncharacterized membrane protein YfcA
MSRPSVRHNRLSLSAVILLFIVGLLTLFVETIVGVLIIILSVVLYLLLVWLTAHFAKASSE